MADEPASEKYIPLGIKHGDQTEIFGVVQGLPPWLDGPRIKAKAKKEGTSYAHAQAALERFYG